MIENKIDGDFDFLIVNQEIPRIGMGLTLRWGTAEFEPYVLGLLNDTRGHTRQGFPQTVYDSLTRILLTHHKLFPDKRVQSNDVWDRPFKNLE